MFLKIFEVFPKYSKIYNIIKSSTNWDLYKVV